jgi:galactitol-specific phosphotransferase system IIB component|tara:strand:- start:178 stop:363 length:186 start_codon:yes stop_codon:yes gene_type:complete
MIKVSFIIDIDPEDVDLSQALDAMHASVNDIADHLEAVDIFVTTQRMDETMCVEKFEGGEE